MHEAEYWGEILVETAAKYIYGLEISRYSPVTVWRRFVAHFGVAPRHCGLVWLFCHEKAREIDHNVELVHLLWTMNLLKSDDSEHTLHGRWRADEKTIRKYVYVFLEALSSLKVVRTLPACC